MCVHTDVVLSPTLASLPAAASPAPALFLIANGLALLSLLRRRRLPRWNGRVVPSESVASSAVSPSCLPFSSAFLLARLPPRSLH